MLQLLTLATVALAVIALIGYLAATAWALIDTRHSMAAMADGLEAAQRNTAQLEAQLAAVNDTMSDVYRALAGARRA